jgi:2-methylcitrate dehydratase PrpD
MSLTAEVAEFVVSTRYSDLPAEVVGLAKSFILDGLGVILAGASEKGSRILRARVEAMGGRQEATALGTGRRFPVAKAALLNGMAGHALDYDDTQLSTSKEAVYGLLTHPTVPVLSAALALGERGASGKELLAAYVLGVEVECRVADAISPRHYRSGFHSTATIGGLGAAVAAAKLARLREEPLRRALGIAASMAGGLRENFGTMTKPLHAGRAAENGVLAVDLARAGFTAAANILEAERGFFRAMGGGYDPAKISGRLGRPYYFQAPGISIKPYPSGSLSHPAQDLILELASKHELRAEEIEAIEVGTNSNVPNALIYPMPETALEAKFSIPFCMAIGVIERRAGLGEFTDRKVRDPRVRELMERVRLYVDEELEALGYDQVRSRVRVRLRDGRVIEGRADVARGHPSKPMGWMEIVEKFRDCSRRAIARREADRAVELTAALEDLPRVAPLIAALAGRRGRWR